MKKRTLATIVCMTGACAFLVGSAYVATTPSTLAQASTKASIDYVTMNIAKYQFVYNGKKPALKPSVVANGKMLKKGRDYSVSYQQMQTSSGHFSVRKKLTSAPTKVGVYRVVATGKNRYTGVNFREYQIIPKETTVKSVRGGKKSLKATWRKQSKQVDGYIVRCFTTTGKRHEKSVTVRGAGKTKATISGLKSGRTYYVGVRPYKEVAGYTIQATATPQKPARVR